MIIKTYPVGHLNDSGKTEADWVNPLFSLWSECYGHTYMRVLWTEEKLSSTDRAQLEADGYLLYVTDRPLCKEDGPGFAHSMFFTPAEQQV